MICVSLGNIGFNRCVESLLKVDCAEIRLDLMDLTEDEVKLLFSEPCTLVATCRPGKYIEEERISMLTCAIQYGAQYVDVEIESEARFLHKIREHTEEKGVKLIISYHNYEKTPSTEELEEIIKKARLMGADIVKLATMAIYPEDNARMLGLYSKHKDIIAFCMGKEGLISRIAAPLLGADFTFAAQDDSVATAPGQITFDKMQKIYELMSVE